MPRRILHQADVEAIIQAEIAESTVLGSSGGGGSAPLWVMRFVKPSSDMNQDPLVPWAAGEVIWPLSWTDPLPAFPDESEFNENRIAVSEVGLYSGWAYVSTQSASDPGFLGSSFEWAFTDHGVAYLQEGSGWLWQGSLSFGPTPVEAPPYQSFTTEVHWSNTGVVATGGSMTAYLSRWA